MKVGKIEQYIGISDKARPRNTGDTNSSAIRMG